MYEFTQQKKKKEKKILDFAIVASGAAPFLPLLYSHSL